MSRRNNQSKYKTRNNSKYHTQYNYSLQNLAKASDKELIHLYNHLVAVMHQRLRYFERKGYSERSDWYNVNVNRFMSRGENLTPNVRAEAIQELQRELNRADSTTTGYEKVRDKILKTLHDPELHNGRFDYVNAENLDEWGDFMDYMRDISGGAITYYDADELHELWNKYDQYGVYSDEFQQAFDSFMNSPTTSISESTFRPNEYNT